MGKLIVQVPMTGYVEFTLVPAGTPIGQGGIVPDKRLGLASVTIVKQPGNSGVYGVPPARVLHRWEFSPAISLLLVATSLQLAVNGYCCLSEASSCHS